MAYIVVLVLLIVHSSMITYLYYLCCTTLCDCHSVNSNVTSDLPADLQCYYFVTYKCQSYECCILVYFGYDLLTDLTRSEGNRFHFPLLTLMSPLILWKVENRVKLMVLLQNTLYLLIALLMYVYLYYLTFLFFMVIYLLILWGLLWFLSLKIKRDTSDKNSYSPIALVTAASKLFEICILEVSEPYLLTHDHQIGFKSKHSTNMCIFTVKSLVKYYTGQNTPVYTCLLDASKAFEWVNHWTLFCKINRRSCSVIDSARFTILVSNATSLY